MRVMTQEDSGPAGNEPVQLVPVREPAREHVAVPAGSLNPLRVRMRVRKAPDGFPVILQIMDYGQVAAELLDAADDGVDVRVLETGKQRAASKIDDLGPRPAQGDGLLTQRRDPVAGHGQSIHGGRARLA